MSESLSAHTNISHYGRVGGGRWESWTNVVEDALFYRVDASASWNCDGQR